MSTQLSQIAKKAKLDPKARFTSLAHLLTSEFLKENLGKDEPESGRRSRWAERRGVWERARNANRSDLQTAKGRHLSGTAGSQGRYTQRAGQSRDKAARNSDGRGQAVATGGSAHTGSCVRSRFPRLQSWL